MESFNGRICVSATELTSEPDQIMSKVAYAEYTKVHPHVRLRKGGGPGRPALLDFNLLRHDIQVKYIKKYGNPNQLVTTNSLRQMIDHDVKALTYFQEYLLPDGRHLPESKQKEYYANAITLNGLNKRANMRKSFRACRNNPGATATKAIWPKLAEEVRGVKADLGHTLPENHLRLKAKLEQYKAEGYGCLVSGKWLNKNAGKVVDSEQQATLRQLLRKHQNLDNEQICTSYNIMAEKLGWEKVTPGTVYNYRVKWDLLTYGGQHGETSFDNERAMLVKRKAPAFPLYYWTMDGWDVELYYQATAVNAKGHSVTTYTNRLTVVVILDPCCKYPVGYAIGTHENPQLIKEALRNAINHTKELFGFRHKVHQLQTDRYGKGALTPFYEAISKIYTPARAHNAKAKVIEPYFNYLNRNHCQFRTNWSGFGVATGSKNQPNSDYLQKIKSSFPDEAGCRRQITEIIEAERTRLVQAYLAAYAEMPEQDKILMSDEEFIYRLGETTGYTNRLSAAGLVVTLAGIKREYDCFDPAFRHHRAIDWVVRYIPGDEEKVLATNADGSLRFLCEEKYVQPMALHERTEGDAEHLAKVRQFNQAIKEEVMSVAAEDYKVLTDMFERNPQLEGTFAKHQITDSMGQHKDQRNAARMRASGKMIEAGRKMLAKQNETAEAARQRTQQELEDELIDRKFKALNITL